jgi:cytochrome c553
MTPLIKNLVLLAAFVATSALVLRQLFHSGDALSPDRAGESKIRRAAASGRLRRWAFRAGALAIVLGAGGFLLAASGIMPIKASSGHWAITAWVLNFSMERSVTTHAWTITAPSLEDEALVLKGAGHYEIGCRPCHGSPELERQPRIALWMTPHPPNLSRQIPLWDANELFYIVKHGVKFTGMPAWPAQKRDDEVWAMVAFLQRLPRMSAEEYRRLARAGAVDAEGDAPLHDLLGPDKKVPEAVTRNCGRCHGIDGTGRGNGAFPKLAGQKPDYFIASMEAYARGDRFSGIMEPIAVGLSREATVELARYYAGLPVNAGDQGALGVSARAADVAQERLVLSRSVADTTASGPVSAGTNDFLTTRVSSRVGGKAVDDHQARSGVARGREIALNGIPKQRVPACSQCHGPGELRRNPHYPVLAGQYADYLFLQLTLFQNKARGGTSYAHLMQPVGAGLTPEQMRDVALFYQSLGSQK